MSAYFTIFRNLLPELITVFTLALFGASGMGELSTPLLFPIGLFIGAFFLRVVWNSALITHGLGHVCTTAILDENLSFISRQNILENRSYAELLTSCIPGSPIFLPWLGGETQPWVNIGRATSQSVRLKALGGIAFNISAILLLLPTLRPFSVYSSLNQISVQLFIIAWIGAHLLAVMSSRSDVIAAMTGTATHFYCGNFGFLGKRHSEDGDAILPARTVEIFKAMGRETEIRGEQAGGGVTVARDGDDRPIFVGQKVINRKRQNLTQSLEAAFSPARRKAQSAGTKALDEVAVGAWHYRYATSGPPSIAETHWHEWTPAREADVWRAEKGKWVCDRKWVNHRITHNGDFDAWMPFGRPIENATLGLWLERVLHAPNETLGDSPKIAGMMDLLVTQGMWDASLRLAYQMGVASSVAEAFGEQQPSKSAPNTAPPESQIEAWAMLANSVFEKYRGELLLPYADSILEVSRHRLADFEKALFHALSTDYKVKEWTRSQQSAFVKHAVYAFFHNNLYQATKLFVSKATGTFGLAALSTLSEKSLVLSAWRQSITIGFNVQDEYMLYASEPAAVNAVLSQVPRAYRLDLDQKLGEIAWVGADNVTVYSISKDRELLSTELDKRWIPLQENPYILPPAISTEDPVKHDIKDIPRVLAEVDAAWQDPTSFNRRSADYLAELLAEKADIWRYKRAALNGNVLNGNALNGNTLNGNAKSVAEEQPLDLLITGVESSLWLGEQFAKDLRLLFPGLRIDTLSSNRILRRLRGAPSSLQLGPRSIVLAISQSGQTFPTLQATHAFEALRQQKKIGELFIMTGELCSLMGSAISQHYYAESTFTCRIFVNGSGRRTAEPPTVAIAAAHATLTELLLNLGHQLRSQFPESPRPFNMFLTKDDLLYLEQMKADFLSNRVVALTGRTHSGKRIKSVEHQTITQGGHQWAAHILETPIVWAIHAAYVAITVGLSVPLVQSLLRAVVAVAHLPAFFLWLLPLATLADILIYIFGPWLWTMGLRYFQGRPLTARTGIRTLVIGDAPWVHRLLQAYVSKLFSLSYGIASLNIHSSDPKDHMLHHFGHRVKRGTLVFLGVPDGRRHPVQKIDERAVVMTGKQANSIRHLHSGAEIVALGHNPAIAHQGFQNAIVLSSDLSAMLPNEGAPGDRAFKSRVALEQLQESRFSAFERLLAGYTFFWALAKQVSAFPFLRYQHWKSQSRTRIMTTAAPIARTSL